MPYINEFISDLKNIYNYEVPKELEIFLLNSYYEIDTNFDSSNPEIFVRRQAFYDVISHIFHGIFEDELIQIYQSQLKLFEEHKRAVEVLKELELDYLLKEEYPVSVLRTLQGWMDKNNAKLPSESINKFSF
ncbi:MAG: hypothetical protein FWE43_04720 [Streptococcaceae bacterium]|nr:hypothetical protein [Streptococcaceae bacterium]